MATFPQYAADGIQTTGHSRRILNNISVARFGGGSSSFLKNNYRRVVEERFVVLLPRRDAQKFLLWCETIGVSEFDFTPPTDLSDNAGGITQRARLTSSVNVNSTLDEAAFYWRVPVSVSYEQQLPLVGSYASLFAVDNLVNAFGESDMSAALSPTTLAPAFGLETLANTPFMRLPQGEQNGVTLTRQNEAGIVMFDVALEDAPSGFDTTGVYSVFRASDALAVNNPAGSYLGGIYAQYDGAKRVLIHTDRTGFNAGTQINIPAGNDNYVRIGVLYTPDSFIIGYRILPTTDSIAVLNKVDKPMAETFGFGAYEAGLAYGGNTFAGKIRKIIIRGKAGYDIPTFRAALANDNIYFGLTA